MESESCSVMSDSLWLHGLYSPWNSPGQNTGVDSLSLLQGIFPTQGSNPGLLHYKWILYQLSHKGSPRILEWVTYPFSSRSSRPKDRTRVSCIAGKFCTKWAIREAHGDSLYSVGPSIWITFLTYCLVLSLHCSIIHRECSLLNRKHRKLEKSPPLLLPNKLDPSHMELGCRQHKIPTHLLGFPISSLLLFSIHKIVHVA